MTRAETTPPACRKCGNAHVRSKPWNGEPDDLCEACEAARLEEISRIAGHHDGHPEECCCHTSLGRECCMAPAHGDLYRALCVENGKRFSADFRAKNAREATELGREHAAGWGGECISVRRLRRQKAT